MLQTNRLDGGYVLDLLSSFIIHIFLTQHTIICIYEFNNKINEKTIKENNYLVIRFLE